jgi:hypothetical protein
MAVIVSMELCRDHAVEFGKGFSWDQNPQLKKAAALAAQGRAEPDFDRAFHDCVRLDGEAFAIFKRAQAG